MASAARSLVHRFRVRELKRALDPEATTSSSVTIRNPFLPYFNEDTGRWALSRYSLRRQAELVKEGRLDRTLHLLPFGPKSKPPENRTAKPKRVHGNTKGVEKGVKPTIDVKTRINWIGEVKAREVAGADVGNRLYSGKKQMFKGHKWERVIKRRREHQRTRMRHMHERILKWRLYRVSKKPWPLSRIRPGSSARPKKLPF